MKATWIWQTDLIASQQDEILSFLEENDVNLLYLRIDLEKSAVFYRPFVKAARNKGIEVHALGGHPSWALKENFSRIQRLLTWVKEYNRNVAEEEKLDGIHVDVEPYLLPEWKQQRAMVIRQWMENIDAFVKEAETDSDLQLGCDTPFWFDGIPLPDQAETSLAEWIISRYDHVTLMAYRDRADGSNGIAALVKNELEMANKLNKKIIVAVEIKKSDEGNFVSFHEEGKTAMNRQLDWLIKELNKHPSFAGTAVHSYEHWRNAKD